MAQSRRPNQSPPGREVELIVNSASAVEGTWQVQDSQGLILALAFRFEVTRDKRMSRFEQPRVLYHQVYNV